LPKALEARAGGAALFTSTVMVVSAGAVETSGAVGVGCEKFVTASVLSVNANYRNASQGLLVWFFIIAEAAALAG
jgi:hypothetical protein